MKSVRALDKFNQIVKISDVKSGAGDELYCIGCGGKLIARKGDVNAHHFAHLNTSSEGGCSWGLESELHLIAKEAIAHYKKITIPIGHIAPTGKVIELNNVMLEIGKANRIPDITAYYEGYEVLIEIAVTHKCGKDKILEIRKRGLDCIEYDLSSYDLIKNEVNNVEQVYQIIESSPARILSYCPSSELGRMHYKSDVSSHRSLIIEGRAVGLKNQEARFNLNKTQSVISEIEITLKDKHNQVGKVSELLKKLQNDATDVTGERLILKEAHDNNEIELQLIMSEAKLIREMTKKNELLLEMNEDKISKIDDILELREDLNNKIAKQDDLIANGVHEISKPFIDELKDKIDKQNVHIVIKAEELDSWRFRQGIDSASRFRTSGLPQEQRSAWLDMEIKRKEVKLNELNG